MEQFCTDEQNMCHPGVVDFLYLTRVGRHIKLSTLIFQICYDSAYLIGLMFIYCRWKVNHNTSQNYISLYFFFFVDYSHWKRSQIKAAHHKEICILCYIQILSTMSHFLRKLTVWFEFHVKWGLDWIDTNKTLNLSHLQYKISSKCVQ